MRGVSILDRSAWAVLPAAAALCCSGVSAQVPRPTTPTASVQDSQSAENQLQEITVTGSHIRGEVPIGSQLNIYSREDLDQSGAATVDQFARVMPQNFSNTVIDGHRIAPAGSDGSLTDISMIPLSAVDHIEVLSDGAETGLRYGAATEGGPDEVTARWE